jgi:hypothetical protein
VLTLRNTKEELNKKNLTLDNLGKNIQKANLFLQNAKTEINNHQPLTIGTDYEKSTNLKVIKTIKDKVNYYLDNSTITLLNIEKERIKLSTECKDDENIMILFDFDMLKIEQPDIENYIDNSLQTLSDKFSEFENNYRKLLNIKKSFNGAINNVKTNYVELEKYNWKIEEWFTDFKRTEGLIRSRNILNLNNGESINDAILEVNNLIIDPDTGNANTLELYSSLNFTINQLHNNLELLNIN